MPVYNAADFLVEAIDSILDQTYKHFELIIINDASTDDSGKIIAKYKKNYPKKIRVITLKKPLGQSGDPATNLGIKRARGKYIAKMDADDIAHPDRLKTQVEYLKRKKRVFLVGSAAYVIDKEGKTIGKKDVPLKHSQIYQSFFLYSYIIHPSIMFRNKKIRGDFYQTKFPYFNEYYTFFKLMNQGKIFANLPEPLIYYRIHGANNTFRHIKTKFLSTLSIRKEFVFKLGYEPTVSQLLYTLGQTLFVFLLPDQVITTLYLLSRRVITVKDILSSAKSWMLSHISLAKRIRYFLLKWNYGEKIQS